MIVVGGRSNSEARARQDERLLAMRDRDRRTSLLIGRHTPRAGSQRPPASVPDNFARVETAAEEEAVAEKEEARVQGSEAEAVAEKAAAGGAAEELAMRVESDGSERRAVETQPEQNTSSQRVTETPQVHDASTTTTAPRSPPGVSRADFVAAGGSSDDFDRFSQSVESSAHHGPGVLPSRVAAMFSTRDKSSPGGAPIVPTAAPRA